MTVTETEPYHVMVTREARQVFRNAMNTALDWDGDRTIGNAVWDLGMALKTHGDMFNGILPAFFSGLPAGPDARERALRWAAETAAEKAGEVTRLIPAAAIVNGTEGGEAA